MPRNWWNHHQEVQPEAAEINQLISSIDAAVPKVSDLVT